MSKILSILMFCLLGLFGTTKTNAWAYYSCNGNMPAGASRYCTCIYIVDRNASGDVDEVFALFGCMEVANATGWSCGVCDDCPPSGDFRILHGNVALTFPNNNIGPISTME